MKLATVWPRSGHDRGYDCGGKSCEPFGAETAHGRANHRGLARGATTAVAGDRGRRYLLVNFDGKPYFGGQIVHNWRAIWTLLL